MGIRFDTIPIEAPHAAAWKKPLAPLFTGTKEGLAEENIPGPPPRQHPHGPLQQIRPHAPYHRKQNPRSRRSVTAPSTATCAAVLAVISDVPKTMVYDLARFINKLWESQGRKSPIPEGSITKPPSAELRPNQTDQDSLPPYDILDAIIERYVEQEKSVADILAEGFDAPTVIRIVRLVDVSEYKRKQMAPGIKVTSRAFGFGRRMPIAQGYDPKMPPL